MVTSTSSPIHALFKGSALGGAIYVAAALINIVLQFVLTRQLGQAGYGVFTFVYSLILLLAVPATLGSQMALLRFVPAYITQKEWARLRGVIRMGLGAACLAGLTIAMLAAMVVSIFFSDLEPSLRTALYAGLVLLPLLALVRSGVSVVRGFERLVPALMANMVLVDLAILCGVLALAIFAVDLLSPGLAMMFAVLGAVLALLLLFGVGRAASPVAARSTPPAYLSRLWWSTAWPLLIVAVARTSFDRMGILLVGGLVDTDAAGLYGLSARLADIVVFPLVALNAYFATRIAELYAQGELARLQQEVRLAGLWTFLAASLVALPLILFPAWFLSFFGEGFAEGALVLRLLVFGQWVIVATGSVGFLLSMTLYERFAAAAVVGAALLNILLGLLLIPIFGAVGGAIGFAVTASGMSLFMGVTVYRKLGITAGILASFVSAPKPAADP